MFLWEVIEQRSRGYIDQFSRALDQVVRDSGMDLEAMHYWSGRFAWEKLVTRP